jgi:hypothetical protein
MKKIDDNFISLKKSLEQNPKSVFISYSHDSNNHIDWVSRLADGLRMKSFQVIRDLDLNPELEINDIFPESGNRYERTLFQRSYELEKAYQQTFREIQILDGTFTFRSPQSLKSVASEISQEYLSKIIKMISLIQCCQNVILVNTPRYIRDTTIDGDQPGGFAFLEFQFLLHQLKRKPSKMPKVISILKSGQGCHFSQAGVPFPTLDFRNDEIYSINLDVLIDYLDIPIKDLRWKYLQRTASYLGSTHPVIIYINDLVINKTDRDIAYTYLFLCTIRCPIGKSLIDQLIPKINPNCLDKYLQEAKGRKYKHYLTLKKFKTPTEVIHGLGAFAVTRLKRKYRLALKLSRLFGNDDLSSMLIAIARDSEIRDSFADPDVIDDLSDTISKLYPNIQVQQDKMSIPDLPPLFSLTDYQEWIYRALEAGDIGRALQIKEERDKWYYKWKGGESSKSPVPFFRRIAKLIRRIFI